MLVQTGHESGGFASRAVAQLAEQRSPKPQVAGSIPVRPANRYHWCWFTKGMTKVARKVLDEPSEDIVADAKKARAARRNPFSRIALFIRQVINELKKVVTPTRKELVNFTFVVLVFVIIMMGLVALLDWIFSFGVLMVFGNPR